MTFICCPHHKDINQDSTAATGLKCFGYTKHDEFSSVTVNLLSFGGGGYN